MCPLSEIFNLCYMSDSLIMVYTERGGSTKRLQSYAQKALFIFYTYKLSKPALVSSISIY